MKYFFIFGNNPALSLAELSKVLQPEKTGRLMHKNMFLLNSADNIDPGALIKNMGGIVKAGVIYKKIKPSELFNSITAMLEPKTRKYLFGISYYGQKKPNIKRLAMEIKKHLKGRGVGSRWITSKEPTLSSVVVEQNGLTSEGIEVIIIADNNNFYLGKTLAVQPFKELSFRDYGRPARDDRSGMLPPKLAQIMINLSRSDKTNTELPIDKFTVLDPFCGSGTILTEALLMGYNNIIGSDISQKAVVDAQANLAWVKTNVLPRRPGRELKIKIFQSDVSRLAPEIKAASIDAVVTEPYLGPQRGRVDLKKTAAELEKLYSRAFREFEKILKNNGRVVIVFPVFTTAGGKKINPDFGRFKIINPLTQYLPNNKLANLTDRNTIIYGRPGQKVWREIIVLKKTRI